MSEFVNYNKRDISLPKGCKDLADLLKRGRKGLSAYDSLATMPKPGQHMEILNHLQASGGLEQLEGMLTKFFGSSAEGCSLSVASANDVRLVLERTKDGAVGFLSFIHNAKREHEMRELLTRYGLEQPPTSSKNIGFPTFIPGAPVWGAYDLRPIPSEPVKRKALFGDLFRAMASTSEISLEYRFYEFCHK